MEQFESVSAIEELETLGVPAHTLTVEALAHGSGYEAKVCVVLERGCGGDDPWAVGTTWRFSAPAGERNEIK
jgi:hypothetical protein